VPVPRRPGRGQQAVRLDQRRESLGLGRVDHPAGPAQLVLQRHVLLERLDLLRLVEQEQVADLVQVDLLVELLLEVLEGLETPESELDVDPVGELGTHAAGGLAGRPGPELALLHEHDVANPGPGQVVGRAQPHHAPADDDDRRVCRELCCHHHPRSAM
jgi:hypothetical protein